MMVWKGVARDGTAGFCVGRDTVGWGTGCRKEGL